MWESLVPALALVLVIEGILPFLSPRTWRDAMSQAAKLPDKALRIMGLLSMLAGVLILYIAH
jgi:uncharacterized protein YjeT (DUF2065 family)